MKEGIEKLKEEVNLLKRLLKTRCPSLKELLRLRGFIIYQMERGEDLLAPEPDFIDSYYENLKKYSFRLFLRDVIKHRNSFTEKDVSRYATKEVTRGYIEYLLGCGLLEKDTHGFRLKKDIKTFGDTLEWLVAEVLKREFSVEAIWGIKFRGKQAGGDYDLIAKLHKDILYMEVKSAPPRQVYDKEVRAFLRRRQELCPDIAIFLMDTHLRMKDKMVPMFEAEIKGFAERDNFITRVHSEIFVVGTDLFISNSKPSIEANLETIFNYYYTRRCK